MFVGIIEGDGDNIFVVWLERSMGLIVKKKFDKNYCIKNIVK